MFYGPFNWPEVLFPNILSRSPDFQKDLPNILAQTGELSKIIKTGTSSGASKLSFDRHKSGGTSTLKDQAMHAHLLSFSPIDREKATVSKQMREESLPSRNPTTAPAVTCTERFIFTIQLVNIVQQVPITKVSFIPLH
jgi:hypothetical protein